LACLFCFNSAEHSLFSRQDKNKKKMKNQNNFLDARKILNRFVLSLFENFIYKGVYNIRMMAGCGFE
jgi:hypothetical protein